MFRVIYQREGWRAFYKGLTASFLGLSHVALQFPLYEYLKKEARVRNKNSDSEHVYEIILASMGAKLVSTLITYPHEVLRSRLQDVRNKDATILSVLRNIVRREGYLSLWSGLHVNIVRMVPATLSTFLTYEYIKKYLVHRI